MEIFVYPHTLPIVKDLLFDAIHELTQRNNELRLQPRCEIDDIVSHLDHIEFNQGRINALTELLDEIKMNEKSDDYVPPPGL